MFISTGNIGLSLRGRKTKYKFGAINLVYNYHGFYNWSFEPCLS